MRNILLIVCVFSILLACSGSSEKPDAYGQFEAVEVIVASQSQGIIQKLSAEEGNKYDSATILGFVDTTSLSLKRKQFEAQLKAINAKYLTVFSQIEVLQQQKNNLFKEQERLQKLIQGNAATQKQLDDVNNNIEVLNKQITSISVQNQSIASEIEAITYQIKQLDDQILKCYIKMPFTGSVLEKYAEETEFTNPSQPILKVANLDKLILKAYVDETQLSEIKLGQKVRVFVDNGSSLKEFVGTLSWISSQSEFSPKIIQNRDERKNLVYAIKILVKNDGSLKIGMLGDVLFK